jgi:hypothetical protein
MRPGGALYHVRAMARALSASEADQRVVGARGFGLALGHLAAEVATALDDLEAILHAGNLRAQTGASFAVDLWHDSGSRHHETCLCSECAP